MARTKQGAAAMKPAPDRRKKGRPAGKETSIGADQILDTARILLKDHRHHKLTQAGIARAACIDPKLIRYYFKTLDHLLVELAHRFILDINDRMAAASNIAGTTEEKIARRIRTLLECFVESPNFWPLIMDKIYLSEDDRARSIRRDWNNTSFQRLSTIVLSGIGQGDIRPNIDPRLLYVVLIGLCEIFVTGKPITDVLFSKYEQEGLADRYGDFIIDLVMLGLRPRSE
jgi:AcrR family transcriptional regulator